MTSRALTTRASSPRLRAAGPWHALLVAALLLLSTAAAAGTIRGDIFRDEEYRIQLKKPAAWHFVPAEQASSRARGALPGDVRSEQAARATLLVAISESPPGAQVRYPARVTLVVEDLTTQPGVQSVEAYAQANLRTLETLLEDFKVEGRSERVRVGGISGLRVEYTGRVARPDGSVAIRGIALHFLRGKTGYAIAAVARAEEFAARRATLQQILSSVNFLP